jgi:hypothetical protein
VAIAAVRLGGLLGFGHDGTGDDARI